MAECNGGPQTFPTDLNLQPIPEPCKKSSGWKCLPLRSGHSSSVYFGATLRPDVQKLEQGWIKVGAKNTAGWNLLAKFCANYVMVLKCKIVNFMEYNVQWTTSGGLIQDLCKSTGSLLLDDKLHVGNHVLAEVVGMICTPKSNTLGQLSSCSGRAQP